MNKLPCMFISSLSLIALAISNAQAELGAVAPPPYTPATGGYPAWYEDTSEPEAERLDLCLSKAELTPGAGYLCILLPNPGIFDDTKPIVFPDNWPDESFWFLAETTIPEGAVAGYEMDAYVAGIEAAFGGGDPLPGDQVSFARIRIRISVPVAGTYTVTHPYGVDTFNVTTPGRRAINMTRDIGIGAPGDFSGALGGDIGPFLHGVGGPYQAQNPETGQTETFIGNPNITEAVTGSPFDTNFVRIEGPAGVIETNLFSVSGKLSDPRDPLPLEIERATYRRTASGTQISVFADSASNSDVCFRETLDLVDGVPPSPCLTDMTANNSGKYFGHNSAATTLPPFIVATSVDPSGVKQQTSLSSKLADVVKISTATYSWDDQTLRVTATSSDEVQVPDLAAPGFGRLSKSGTQQTLEVSDLSQPPATVTVKSAAGGSDTEMVRVVGTAPAPTDNELPVAVDDAAATSSGVPISINLLANDSDPDDNTPLTIVDLGQPATGLGSVALNGTTSVLYTPPLNVTTPLTVTFSYSVQDALGDKSATPATVTVTVSPNLPPTVVNDAVTTLNAPITIDVLANDTDPEGNVPLTINGFGQPAAGQGSVTSNGTTLTYTPPATVTTAFTTTFSYTARDSLGAVSVPASVSVTVNPPLPPAVVENLTVTTAQVTPRSNNRFTWDIRGQTSITNGNVITISVTTANGLQELGTTAVPGTGRWRISLTSTEVVPSANPVISVRSSVGTVVQQALDVR